MKVIAKSRTQFLSELGFPATPKEDPSALVKMDWDQALAKWGESFEVLRDQCVLIPEKISAIRFVTLKNPASKLEIEIYSTQGFEQAQNLLVSVIEITNRKQNPYLKGPPVGDLSAQIEPSGPFARVLWTRAQFMISISSEISAKDEVTKLAHGLDTQMKTNLVRSTTIAVNKKLLVSIRNIRIFSKNKAQTKFKKNVPFEIRWDYGKQGFAGQALSSAAILDAESNSCQILDSSEGALTAVASQKINLEAIVLSLNKKWMMLNSKSISINISD